MVTARGDQYGMLWSERYKLERAGFGEVLTWDAFRSWERSRMPEVLVEEDLAGGLYVLYAQGADHDQAVAFLRRACLVAQRAIDEDKLTSPLCESRFPKNRGALYRAYTYARAILGEPLDIAALKQSSRDFDECSAAAR